MSPRVIGSRCYRIKLSTIAPYLPPGFVLARQTPGGAGRWQEFQFMVNEPVAECDAWFVYDGLAAPEGALCPAENVVLITAEPPAYKVYPARWLRQFKQVITCHRKLRHPKVRISQTALPWFVNKSYDELAGKEFPAKTKPLSIICSLKRNMKGHRRRLAFVQALEAARDLPADLYGRGHRPLADKWEGLAPYRYSIALENSVSPDYWTEKIADCFLAGTVPIYFGCENIDQYFPPMAYELLDIRDIGGSIQKLRTMLAADAYPGRVPALSAAKELVLNRYNLFNLIAEYCRGLDLAAPKTPVSLEPEPVPGKWVRRLYKWRRRYLS